MKKALLFEQDPFTRTLYENEKITYESNTRLIYVATAVTENYCCEVAHKCGVSVQVSNQKQKNVPFQRRFQILE